jgi:signal transduction histidine kinase
MLILSPFARNKEIDLSWSVPDDLKATIDSTIISSILQNLVTNAIKFTNRGGKVTVTSLIESGNLNFIISDSGVGMDEKQLNKLFKLENTSSARGTENETGTGLGLIISKEFIEIHQGKIWVESIVGKGSVFHITFPLTQ